jgi:hypothetical protein
MPLVIVVGGLEPTKDGIGDHARRLAAALTRLGMPTAILALADTRLPGDEHEAPQTDDGVAIQGLRLSASLPFAERVIRGRRFVDKVGGRHLLFAFSPYQFDRRGVVRRAVTELPRLARGLSSSILFHETWIGEDLDASPRMRLVGFAQRIMVQRLARALKPARLYSTNPLYREMLKARGIETEMLPHCGNVPVQATRAESWLPQLLADKGIAVGPCGLEAFYLIGLFGSLYPGLDLPRLLPSFEAAAARLGKRPLIVNIGISGDRPEWHDWRRAYGQRFGLIDIGPATPLRISQFLNSLDLGVTTTALAQFGKSGTAAAFIEHGLPILIAVETPRFRHWRESMVEEYPANCLRITPDLADRLTTARRLPPRGLLAPLATRLAADLSPLLR